MRKMMFFLMTIAGIGIMACKPNKIEECEQLYDKYEIPPLSTVSYNSIYAVTLNYAYAVRGDEDNYQEFYPNPFASHIGDTILLCGFIRHSYGEPFQFKDDQWQCLMVDDSITACDVENNVGGGLDVYGDDKSILEFIDDTKKCYVKGIINYGGLPLTPDFYANNSNSCYYLAPVCHVINVNN